MKTVLIAILWLSAPAQAQTTLQQIAESGRLDDLRWPSFSDYRRHVTAFYQAGGYQLAWIRDGKATSQARAILGVLRKADEKGLHSEDYDGPRWEARLTRLEGADDAGKARFDVALTVCTMRYISDLHIGRVNPRHFTFGLEVEQKKYNLPEFLRQQVIGADDPARVLEQIEPSFAGYQRTKAVLLRYFAMAAKDGGEPLPLPAKTIAPGAPYLGIARLVRLLQLLGDLPQDSPAGEEGVYGGALVEAVKRYQARHGLQADGRLGAQTVKSLNTPLSARIRQLQLTLERWRWLPDSFPEPPVVVNIPEFRLRAFDGSGKPGLEMKVIVGKAYGHNTPVFADSMQYVVLRPYWNVPPSIQRSEIVPAVRKDREYIAKKGFEVTTQGGALVTAGTINDDVLEQLHTGKLAVRQKPGTANSLGLVKLIFPNQHNVYLHSTPAAQLFSQSRRDFSHGCIRVEKPQELTAWALRNNAGWDLERVREAMEKGTDNQQVNLTKPIPVLILYGTAVVDESGTVRFFDDIYGLDASLDKVLNQGYPYP